MAITFTPNKYNIPHHNSCGVVVQWLDFLPIMQEPCVRIHTGEKSGATIYWTNVALPVDMS